MESFIGLKRIRDNENKAESKIVCQTLIKIIDNILSNPLDISKRRIKLDSDDVCLNLMPYAGYLLEIIIKFV
jgi:hypothetical protein